MTSAPLSTRMFIALSVSVVLLALFVRLYFVAVAQIEAPIRGDIIEYVTYAQNLLEHQTFSRDRVSLLPASDSFRSPGYPVFLGLAMLLGQEQWYAWALAMQIVLAGLSVLLTLLLAREFVSRGWAIACALLAAVWPHHIVATATLLSEVLFGTLLLAALYAAMRASATRHTGTMVFAGVLFGSASLVNPVALLLPVVLGGIRLLRGQRRLGVALIVTGMLLPLAWSGRTAMVVPETGTPGRFAMNFVQGSWPQYHRAHQTRLRHPVSQQIITAIDGEIAQLHASPTLGLQTMAARMATDPGFHIAWYLWHKPFLLWAWDIRIGIGDVYYHRITHSPLETHPLLSPIKRTLRWLNPVWFGLMLGFLAMVAAALMRRSTRHAAVPRECLAPGIDLAAILLYLTAVHWLLQAEPRYAIAYRPLELVAAIACLAALVQATRRRLQRSPQANVTQVTQ